MTDAEAAARRAADLKANQHDRLFVTVAPADEGNLDRLAELRALADETGRMLARAPNNPHKRQVADMLARPGLKRVPRDDPRAFLDNVRDIAAGRAIVVQEG